MATLTPEQEQGLIDRLANPDSQVSVDGLSASTDYDAILKTLQWNSQLKTTTATTRPFRIQHLRSPGSIHGS